MLDPQAPQRLKGLWKSGRQKYDSFFATLEEVKREISPGTLSKWCRDNLHMDLKETMAHKRFLLHHDKKRTEKAFADEIAPEKDLQGQLRHANDVIKLWQDAAKKHESRIVSLEKEIAMLKAGKANIADAAEVTALRGENARLHGEITKLTEALALASTAAHDADRLERKCGWCKEPFTTKSMAGKYCSVRCRVAAHRAAHATPPPA
jgi:hypothetical protein